MLYRNLTLSLLTVLIGTCYGMEHQKPITNSQEIQQVIEQGDTNELNNLFSRPICWDHHSLHYPRHINVNNIIDIIDHKKLLINAAQEKNEAAVRTLLEHGANPNVRNETGATALHCCITNENMARLLLQYGANPNICNSNGHTPLHAVSAQFYTSCYYAAHLLLQYNANPDIAKNGPPGHGETPLHTASKHGRDDIVRLLLQYNATPDVRNNARNTPLDEAVVRGLPISSHFLRLFMSLNYFQSTIDVDTQTQSQEETRSSALFFAEWLRKAYGTSQQMQTFIHNVVQPQQADILNMLRFIAYYYIKEGTIAVSTFAHILEQYHDHITHQFDDLQRQPYAMLYHIFYPTSTQQMLYDLGQRIQNREATPIEMQHAYQKHFDAIGRFRDAQGNTFLHYLAHAPVHASYVPLITARIYRVQNIDITSQTTTDIKNIARRYGNKLFFDNFVDQTEKLRWLHKGYKQDKVSLPPEIQEEIAQYIALPRQSS